MNTRFPMRKKNIIIIITIGFLIHTFNAQGASSRNGEIDLRNWDSNEIIKLDGEWGFYWEQFLNPFDWRVPKEKPDLYVNVPSYWTDYELNGERLTGFGFGTYTLSINLPAGYNSVLAFQIPVFDDAYSFYINGIKYAENGEIGQSQGEADPGYHPQIVSIYPDTSILVITIHVSNFEHRRGGFWKSIRFGDEEILKKHKTRYDFLVMISIGSIVTFSIFFLFFFVFYRKNISALYFSITLLGILIRILVTDNYPLQIFWDIPWLWMIRMEYIGTYMAFGFGMWYFLQLYPFSWMRKITLLNSVVMSLLIIFVLISKPVIFGYSMFYFKPAAIVFFTFYLATSFYYLMRRKGTDIFYFVALLIFMLSLVNDLLVSASKSTFSSGYIIHFGVLVFITLNALLLIRTWVYAYKEKIKLNQEIEYMNLNLEKLVKDRMEEVLEGKEEIKKQNIEIANKNQELESLLLSNKKIQNIIASELKGPVTSLLQISDHLNRTYTRPDLKETLQSMKDLSETANHLIDNLLYWERLQKGDVSSEPFKVSMQKIVTELKEYYKDYLSQKSLKMDILMKDEAWAFCDPTLIRIVFRNLVLNAIKYTKKGGRITISAAKPADSEYIVVLIEDNGVGINEKLLKLLNDRQSREFVTSNKGTANETGSGLGIRLAHGLMKINKGKIRIDSEPGKGTMLMVFLPPI